MLHDSIYVVARGAADNLSLSLSQPNPSTEQYAQ